MIIDELIEKAFNDGYEFAQREYGKTGLTFQQAKSFFTPTGKNTKKSAKNDFYEKQGRDLVKGYDAYNNCDKSTLLSIGRKLNVDNEDFLSVKDRLRKSNSPEQGDIKIRNLTKNRARR